MILQKIQEAILHSPECLNSERKQVVKMSECPGFLQASVIALPSLWGAVRLPTINASLLRSQTRDDSVKNVET